MAKGSAEIEKFFRAAFNKGEWEYLRNHEDFSKLIDKDEISLDEFERLARLGHNLLLERDEESRKRIRS